MKRALHCGAPAAQSDSSAQTHNGVRCEGHCYNPSTWRLNEDCEFKASQTRASTHLNVNLKFWKLNDLYTPYEETAVQMITLGKSQV